MVTMPKSAPLLLPEPSPLFSFQSRLDQRLYEARWDPNHAALVVEPSTANGIQLLTPPEATRVGLVRAFEEGRLNHRHTINPYLDRLGKEGLASAYWLGSTFS